MTEAEAYRLVKLLQEAYRRRGGDEFGADTAKLYARMMADLPATPAYKAVLHLISTQPFRPAISEIRRAVAERICPAPDPDAAWDEVRRAIQAYNPYAPAPPAWSDPLIERAVRAFGWSQLVRGEQPEITRAQWIKLYEQLREREMQRRQSVVTGTMGELHGDQVERLEAV